ETHFSHQMLFHVLGMEWCPVGCALPPAFFHGIAGDYIDPNVVNVEFQIGMLSIAINCLGADPLPDFREDLLRPLPSVHCRGKGGEDIQVGLAAQPGVTGEGSLYGDVASDSRFVQYVLNLVLQSLS